LSKYANLHIDQRRTRPQQPSVPSYSIPSALIWISAPPTECSPAIDCPYAQSEGIIRDCSSNAPLNGFKYTCRYHRHPDTEFMRNDTSFHHLFDYGSYDHMLFWREPRIELFLCEAPLPAAGLLSDANSLRRASPHR
jgi:hypothetical protein